MMKGKRRFFAAASCLLLTATCQAASVPAQAALGFQGRIVELGCDTAVASGSVIELSRCPQVSHGNTLAVARVRSVAGAPVSLRLRDEHAGAGGYYEQRYVLVDRGGRSVSSGLYVVTLTAP